MAAWWTRRRAQRAVVRAARGTLPPTIAETATMPAVTVHGPAGEWVLHGIAHGQRRVLRMSPAVRAFLTDAIDSWRAAGERVLLEPALPALLGVDDDLALQADNPFGRLRPGELARVVAGVVPMLILLPFAGIVMRFSRDPEWPYIRAALQDPRALASLAEVHGRLQPSDALEALSPRSGEILRRAYSASMGEAAVAARQPTDVRVHLLVGSAHVRDLTKLLAD